jgi:hypothetical protein
MTEPLGLRAAELDPLAAIAPAALGMLRHTTGDAAAGMALVRRAGGLAPDLIWLPMIELMMLLDRGQGDAALAVQRGISDWLQVRHPDDPVADLYRQLVEHRNRPAEVLAFLRRSAGYPAPQAGAVGWSWAVYLGDPAVALELMNGEHDADGAFDSGFSWFAGLAPARRLAGFADLAAAMYMPDYWRVHGWPPDCRPLDGDAFECGLEEGP